MYIYIHIYIYVYVYIYGNEKLIRMFFELQKQGAHGVTNSARPARLGSPRLGSARDRLGSARLGSVGSEKDRKVMKKVRKVGIPCGRGRKKKREGGREGWRAGKESDEKGPKSMHSV